MLIRPTQTSIRTNVVENHSLLHGDTLIGEHGAHQTCYHGHTVITSLVLVTILSEILVQIKIFYT